MKLSNLFVAMATSLAATTSAAPLSDDAHFDSLQKRASVSDTVTNQLFKRVGVCGSSSFHRETSNGSPSVADCRGMLNSGELDIVYEVVGSRSEVKRSGNCRFMVYSPGHTAIGESDIRDLVRDSIAKFSNNGKVGARGSMDCKGELLGWGGDARVDWWIWKK